MKTPLRSNYLFIILIIHACFAIHLNGQIMNIPKVPDLQQPIDPWWGNLPDNSCAPVSAANICVYWDDSIHHSNALGINSNQPADSIPSYLSFFMGTNGLGDPTRANPSVYGVTSGTITMDIDTGLKEYVRWDAFNMFFPAKPFALPASKNGFDWKIEIDQTMGFHGHMMEIEARRPDIVIFKYWNPAPTGFAIPDEMGGDSIHFFLWDINTTGSEFPNPHEEWYFDEKSNSAGHAVTGVGYLFGLDPDFGGPLPITDWIICHDNWSTTPVNVAVPWADSIWIATITADPGLDTVQPYISCSDTTVYLDENGQYYLNESHIVDSAWDNNGVDQLFLDNYYLLCYQTAVPETITATATDWFGNMAQCTAMVTVIDTVSPVPVCLDTTVYLDSSGNVIIDSSYVDGGSTDNCGISTINISPNQFDCMDTGFNQVDVTITDIHSNSSIYQVLVNVLDTISPLIVCTDTTIYLDASGSFIIDSSYIIADMMDNCAIKDIQLSKYTFTRSDVGIPRFIHAIASDPSGNLSECVATITVQDTITVNLDERITESSMHLDLKVLPRENSISIHYTLPEAGNVYIALFSMQGTLIGVALDEIQAKGAHEINWKANLPLPDGVYICKIKTFHAEQEKKFIFIK
jgi:hypothetical protein